MVYAGDHMQTTMDGAITSFRPRLQSDYQNSKGEVRSYAISTCVRRAAA